MSVSRGRPRAEGGGKSGSITNHSASIVSLSYRKPSRLHWRRVISVQTIVLSFESIQSEGNHNWLKSLSFFFGQTLSARRPLRRAHLLRVVTLAAARDFGLRQLGPILDHADPRAEPRNRGDRRAV